MPHHDRIIRDSNVMLGKPVIRGTRITVELVPRKLEAGLTAVEITAELPHLTPTDL